MRNLYLNSLLITITAMVSINPVYSESSKSSKVSFFCETESGIPTTIAKTENGNIQSVFYWRSEALPVESNAQELCDEVSQELNNNFDSNLSTMGFKGTKLEKLPVICATDKNDDCNLVLLTFGPTEDPIETADFVLASILEPQLQSNKVVSKERGVQSIYYKVNLWELLGL